MDNFDLKKYLAEGKLLKEELEVGNTIEIDPSAFPNFEFPYGTRGEIFDIDKADYASDDLVYTVKLKHIDSQGTTNDTLHIENPNQYLDEGKLNEEDKGSMYQLIKLKDIENPYNLHRDLISSLNRFTRATVAKEQGYQGVGLDNELKLTRSDVNNQSSFHKLDKEEVKDTLKRALELYRSTLNERKLK